MHLPQFISELKYLGFKEAVIQEAGLILQQLLNKLPAEEQKSPAMVLLLYGNQKQLTRQTALLIGKSIHREISYVDLNREISKYIGETEKNLERIFAKASNSKTFLFFDEADALFGKRTSVRDSHDKYANQEVSYFLNRLEQFHGLVMVSAISKKDLHPDFLKRVNLSLFIHTG